MEASKLDQRHAVYHQYGFLPQDPPLRKLPEVFSEWERMLDQAKSIVARSHSTLQGGIEISLDIEMKHWRRMISQVCNDPRGGVWTGISCMKY